MLLMHVLKKLRKCNDPYLLHPLTACTDAPTSFDGILIQIALAAAKSNRLQVNACTDGYTTPAVYSKVSTMYLEELKRG